MRERGTSQDGPPAPSRGGAVDRMLDAGCELAFVAFGSWTLLYHLGAWLGLPTTPLLVATVVLTTALALAGRRWTAPLGRGPRRSGARRPALVALTVATVLAVAASAALTGEDRHYVLGWGLALGSVGVLVLHLVREGPVDDETVGAGPVGDDPVAAPAGKPAAAPVGEPADSPSGASTPPREPGAQRRRALLDTASSVVVILVAVAGGILSLFVRNISFDDIFYVNKAVFVAENGTIPLRDTIYSDQLLPAVRGAGSVPVQSFEVLQGSLAHLVGMSGGTAAYMVTPPVVIALCVWVMWWLSRTWSRGPALVAFAVAAAYLTFGMYTEPGAGGSIAMSSIPLRAAWQGKVVLLCVALPMAFLALSRWAAHRRPRDLVLVFMVGATTVGLSGTAAFLVPPIALAVAAALLMTGRAGWAGALVLGVYPVGAGLATSVLGGGADYGDLLRTAPEAYHGVVGQGIWGWLGSLALLLGAWGVRRGAARTVAGAVCVGAVVLLAPVMPRLVQEVTGAGPLVWRLPWIIPIPVLLGVLAAAPLAPSVGPSATGSGGWSARIRRGVVAALRWVPVTAVVVAVVVGGRVVWDPDSPGEVTPRPAWKFLPPELDRAAAIAARARDLDGPVLAPRLAMSALAITTTDVHAVDPRPFFLGALVEDAGANDARRRLSSDMRSQRATRVAGSFATDLDRLGVAMVCLDPTQVAARGTMERLGWSADPTPAVDLRCWRRPA